MNLDQRINAFVMLGRFLAQFASPIKVKNNIPEPTAFHADSSLPDAAVFFEQMEQALEDAHHQNKWFTYDNLAFSCKSWGDALTKENITNWVTPYAIGNVASTKTVAIVMAGNIPLVGFHDFISVLLCGHKAQIKLSSNDNKLLPVLANYLCTIEPGFRPNIKFVTDTLHYFDAVIATGSNNTATYFDHYFSKYPHIIRKNRNAVAIIKGDETPKQMSALADDVFRYFGLGCRNVSKIYIPDQYNLDHFFKGMFAWKKVINNNKYINNYDYNKAVYLMSDIKLFDNEFMLLKEDLGYSSPISVVFYERYKDMHTLRDQLQKQKQHIQCIVSSDDVPFGVAQSPALSDYADGVDTIDFLIRL